MHMCLSARSRHSFGSSGGVEARGAVEEGAVLLPHYVDHYSGINIEMEAGTTLEQFKKDMHFSLVEWRKDKKRGIWLKLKSPEDIDLINESVKHHGFQFHSVDHEGEVLLSNWLPGGESTLPVGPSFYAGVGVVCISKDNKILAVQEKNGWLKNKGFWKIVTGLADPNEPIEKAAIRELLEETGIKGNFKRVLALRQGKGTLKKSDLFFVCLVEPLSEEIIIQQNEIEKACWMELDEFFSQEWLTSRPAYKALNMAILDSLRDERQASAGLLLERFEDVGQSIFIPPSFI